MNIAKPAILITGGTGFLGENLIRHFLELGMSVISVSRTWDRMEKVEKKFIAYVNAGQLVFELADIRNENSMREVFATYPNIESVVHAAAFKSVPSANSHPQEMNSINIKGLENVVRESCISGHVTNFVFISSDKAVNPVNIYGVSKKLGEQYISAIAKRYPHMNFSICRYGNVIGSTGSILPVWVNQWKTLGHVKITNPDITRFWLPAKMAVELVNFAMFHKSRRGEANIYLPDVTSSTLSYFHQSFQDAVGEMVDIEKMAEREGDKLYEELASGDELNRIRIHQVDSETFFYIISPTVIEDQRSVRVDNGALFNSKTCPTIDPHLLTSEIKKYVNV